MEITRVKPAYALDRKKVPVMITALNAAYDAYIQSQESQESQESQKSQELIIGQGGGNKKYRASSGNRTKKRNKRNKQNRRNRTKKTKSRSRLVRRCK